MSKKILSAFLIGCLCFFSPLSAEVMVIDGSDAIYLAGRTDIVVPPASDPWGFLLRHVNLTPEEVMETHPDFVPVIGGAVIQAVGPATGGINFFNGFGPPFYPPDGNGVDGSDLFFLDGISGYKGPEGPLVGVFLDDSIPDAGPAPATLDFTPLGLGTDFSELMPELGQVFYIGDGFNSVPQAQRFIAPAGATRLFLGIPDGFGFDGPPGAYDDNDGSYQIELDIIFGKELTSGPDRDGDGAIDLAVPINVETPTAYDFTITWAGDEPVLIYDTVSAEWDVTHVEFDDNELPLGCGETEDFSGDYGMVDIWRGGKPGKKCNSDTSLSWMPPATSVGRIFWSESSPGTVNVVNVDGTGAALLATTAASGALLRRVTDVEIDPASNSLYFTNWTVPTSSGDEAIYHIDLATLVQTLFHNTSASSATGFASGLKRLAIDPTNGDVYFTRGVSYANPIEVSKVDITGFYTQLYTAPLIDGWFPSGIDVDPAAGFIYWGDPTFTGVTFDGAINRITMAGTGPITLLPQLVTGLGRSLAYDPGFGPAGTIFVSAFDYLNPAALGEIWAYDLASGTPTPIVVDHSTGFPDIELDTRTQRIYWTDYVRGEIRSANYDGSGMTTEISGLTGPYGLALEFNKFSLNVETLARCHDKRNNQLCRPTSCGALYLNYGATAYLKDPDTDELVLNADGNPIEVAGPTDPICLAAVDDVNGDGEFAWDGSGDEDGDGLSDYDEACVLGEDPCVFTPCVGLSDFCIDGDGIATAGSGLPGAGEVWVGEILTAWPTGFWIEGLDWFDNDGSCTWTFGDDLHLEDPGGSCITGIRNGFHEVGADCDVIDLDGSFFTGQQVDVDLETGSAFTGCPGPDPLLLFYDSNGNGFWDNGEDIVLDANANGVFD